MAEDVIVLSLIPLFVVAEQDVCIGCASVFSAVAGVAVEIIGVDVDVVADVLLVEMQVVEVLVAADLLLAVEVEVVTVEGTVVVIAVFSVKISNKFQKLALYRLFQCIWNYLRNLNLYLGFQNQ